MEWVRGDTLGHGSFATVSLAKPKTQTTQLPQLMAVKSSPASHSSSLINEKSILDNLTDCPHIIRCFASDFTYQNGEKTYNLLLEYASGGSLSDKLRRSGDRKLPESHLRQYVRSILKGVSYIHDQGYVHCDIKPQNILLCSCGDEERAKIGDFGLAKKAGSRRGREKVELTGTPMYMSPEMAISGEQEGPADIWALGCLVVEMAAGGPVWRLPSGADMAHLLMRVGKGDEVPDIPNELSEEGRDFLMKCFRRDPKKRWTAQMLLDHPFAIGSEAADNNCSYEDVSGSPKCPFDFPEWVEERCKITSLPSSEFDLSASTVERFRKLAYDRVPDWSVMDSWVTVR